MSILAQLPNTYRVFFGQFSGLTAAQKALIQPILNAQDIVLQAGTGSGKTEAVLAPATERLLTATHPFTILYIVPTRALALDMNRRIKPIFKRIGLKSGIRTGDGKTMQDGSPHLLILTPESLDVLLGSQNQDNKQFLNHVRIMIIDEVHVFLHEDRGHQLSYLRHRLTIQTKASLQTILLSATISNLENAAQWFNLKTVFYYKEASTRTLQPCWVHLENEEEELVPFFDDLHQRFGCRKLLVFANSRKKCEQLYDALSHAGVFSETILLHYSNLSTKERRSIESSFRHNTLCVCIATSTLEMGIDIGDVDGVVLMGPAPSTITLLQRIGRGNRRQNYVRFWGVCSGATASRQLLRFLALVELAKNNTLEAQRLTDSYSVLFQQILSCLYAKKIISLASLQTLFSDKADECKAIFNDMLLKDWLKPMPMIGLVSGGWRYAQALIQQTLWSNFPPTDKEYDVILAQETIAVLPLSVVKQLNIGDLIQLTGKVLRIVRIEEKQIAREVFVERSQSLADKEIQWVGSGIPITFEVAQTIRELLLHEHDVQGLLNRTRRLLASERDCMDKTVLLPNGIRVRSLKNKGYRYQTYLGTTGNFIIYHLIKLFLADDDELELSFDELGIECSQWLRFEALNLPHSIDLFQDWVADNLALLKTAFSWNNWLRWLNDPLQQKEIASRLLDLRVLNQFAYYNASLTPPIPPEFPAEQQPSPATQSIELKGRPFSLEDEQLRWGKLDFAPIPAEPPSVRYSLTASQIQGYVTQQFCPRWARFQQLQYAPPSHPRLDEFNQAIQLRQQDGIKFKQQVIEALQRTQTIRQESTEFTWKEAINEVISSQKPRFVAGAKLEFNQRLKGNPDLIYIKPEAASIRLEIWDIKNGYTITYAQKWRVAFYAYLLDSLLADLAFSLPVSLSNVGGIIYRSLDKEYESSPFILTHFKSLIPSLIVQWETDSMQAFASNRYTFSSTCTSCRYFSYCYQETLFNAVHPKTNAIVSLGRESNDFPSNTKQWFFIHYEPGMLHWQCWANKELISDNCFRSEAYESWSSFQEAVVKSLLSAWHQAISQGNNPHCLVYELFDWYSLQKAFESTPLKSLWATHSCCTSIQAVLQKHFSWPVVGRLTITQVALCLGLLSDSPHLLSLYHKEWPGNSSFDVYRNTWNWCLSQVNSRRKVSFDVYKSQSVALINSYLAIVHRENECRIHELLEFQTNPITTRVEHFRAIAPIRLLDTIINGKQKIYQFSIDSTTPIAKFRVGDFLKLSPIDSLDIQAGFNVILESYCMKEKLLSVRSMSKPLTLSKQQTYMLDENATDWNTPKLVNVLNRLKDKTFKPHLIQLLQGHRANQAPIKQTWISDWYQTISQTINLNEQQIKALMLPFTKNIGLIEGPPGTGKTHLLVWTLAALIAEASYLKAPIKILVTAMSHQAIDQILKKVAHVVGLLQVDNVSIWKYGRYEETSGVDCLNDCQPLFQNTNLILGATGFGIYQLLEGKQFPALFDWIVFDEASQILPSYACLSLVFGKGNALLYGDTQQLPPILNGQYDNAALTPSSILQALIGRYDSTPRVRLNETYRMNEIICKFPSQHWYDGELFASESNKHQRLSLPQYPLFHDKLDEYLNPSRPIVIVEQTHTQCRQSSQEEATWIALAVKRLLEEYKVDVNEIGIISPHRLQNNLIISALQDILSCPDTLPTIDTVERMQGLEFDVVIFSATVSEQSLLHSSFLKDYRRFNVVLTRARKKFLLVASPAFFQSMPSTEMELMAHLPFRAFFVENHNCTEF